MTTQTRSRLAVVVTALTTVAVNILLDTTTSLPMLLRWVIAIAVGIDVAAVFLRPRSQKQPDQAG